MRRFIDICFLMLCLSCFSCNKEGSPVSPSGPKTIVLSDYGSYIDSAYFKMWSDSSWEKFNRLVTINSVFYVTLITDGGTEYYYSASGYAGFKPSGHSLILFNTPMPSGPDTVISGQTYTREVSFVVDSSTYYLRIQETLQDTVTVTVPFGVFGGCPWFKSTVSLSGGGAAEQHTGQFWLAKGPSDIKQVGSSGGTVVMVRGRVNGRGWGMSFPKQTAIVPGTGSPEVIAEMLRPLLRIQNFSAREFKYRN